MRHKVYALHNNKPPSISHTVARQLPRPYLQLIRFGKKNSPARPLAVIKHRPEIIRVSEAFFFLNPALPVDANISSSRSNKHHRDNAMHAILLFPPSYSQTHRSHVVQYSISAFPPHSRIVWSSILASYPFREVCSDIKLIT